MDEIISSKTFNIIPWISYSFDRNYFGICSDSLSLFMLIIVLSISTFVHYYSIDYMYSDPRLITFLKYLSGFTLAMLLLILSNNMAFLFLGWEGVGIFSYLLIGFWYTWTSALKASLKAVIVNKIGDVSLLIAMSLCLFYFGTLDFFWLKILITYLLTFKLQSFTINILSFDISIFTLISFFLLIAAVGKSAQLGLHTWLPDAMEGPTPVSALIHAATMVTAGVYLIVWTSFFFENSYFSRNLVIIVGGLTALFGSIVACFQYDIKKIIAFSTCSQIGYMFLACGLSCYHIAMFHLFTHAFFKALLFLCAGSIIHSISDQQDIWKMGGFFKLFPLTYLGFIIGFFSLMGLPFTSGFYSKDLIIELAFAWKDFWPFYGFVCSLLSAFFTAFYSYRFLFYVFFSTTKQPNINLKNLWENGFYILTVIIILSFLTIVIGFFSHFYFGTTFFIFYFKDSIFLSDKNNFLVNHENFIFLTPYLKLFIFSIPLFGFFSSFLFYKYLYKYYFFIIYKNYEDKNYYFDYFIYLFRIENFFRLWGMFDYFYNKSIIFPIINFSYNICYLELDKGWYEFLFIKLPSKFFYLFSRFINNSFFTLRSFFYPSISFVLTFIFSLILFTIVI